MMYTYRSKTEKMSTKGYGFNDTIMFGIIYVPPMQSRFYNNAEFELLEQETQQMSREYEHIFLCGDFNAQTAQLPDYTSNDAFLSNHFNLDTDVQNYVNQNLLLEANNIKVNRASKDK